MNPKHTYVKSFDQFVAEDLDPTQTIPFDHTAEDELDDTETLDLPDDLKNEEGEPAR